MLHRWKGFVTGMLATAAILLAACGKGGVDQIVNQQQIVTIIIGTGTPDQNHAFHICPNGTMNFTGQVAINNGVPVSGTWTSSDKNTAIVDPTGHVTGVAPGAAVITFTPNDPNLRVSTVEVIVDATCGTGNTPTGGGTGSLIFTPSGGNLTVNVPQQLSVTCKDASGNTVACDASASTINPIVITASGLIITCVTAGQSAVVTVSAKVNGATVSNQGTFSCVAANTPTIGLNQSGPITLKTGQFCPVATYTVSTQGGALGNWSVSNNLMTFQGGSNSTSQVTVVGVAGQSGSSRLTVNGVNGGSAYIDFTLDNTACSGGNEIPTVTPGTLNFTLCPAGYTGTSLPQQITVAWKGNTLSGTDVLYQQQGQLLSISPSGLATPANLGSSVMWVSPKAAPTDTVRIQINVTNTACNPESLVANPSSISVTACSGFQNIWPLGATIKGTNTAVVITSWSSMGNLGSISGNTLTLNGTAGSVMLIGTTQTGATITIPVTVSACPQTNTFTITGPTSIASGQGCPANTTPLVYNMNGTPYNGTVTWTSSNTGVASVNSNGLVTPAAVGQTGSVIITATGGNSSATYTVSLNSTSCQTGAMAVTVSPSTFSDAVGQQRTFTAAVKNAPNGTTPTISWTVSPSTCAGSSSGSGTIFAVSWIAACSNATVTATASAGSTQASGAATGVVTNGDVNCTITYNGTTSGTITITQGQTINVTASCTNGYTSFKPYWSSTDPLIVMVQGATFVENINNVNWYSGPTAVINGHSKGTANIGIQVDLRNPVMLATRTVTVQ